MRRRPQRKNKTTYRLIGKQEKEELFRILVHG
jgi:hypothetical protein